MEEKPKTPKGLNSQKFLLEKSFGLFMQNGYEKTTITEIIKFSGMSRGAIFYYYKDKLSLFKAVIDKYLISQQSIADRIEYTENTSLPEFIDKYIEQLENSLIDIYNIPQYYSARYFSISYQALTNYYPEATEKIHAIFAKERQIWTMIIKNDIEKGRIRNDINIENTVRHIMYTYYGMFVEQSYTDDVPIEDLKPLLMDIYKYIKI